MKRIFKFCLSFIVAIGLAFSVVGCSVLDGLNERESAAKNNADESGPTAEYEGNKVNQSNYNGVTYLEEDFDYNALYEENYKAVVTVSVTGTVSNGFFGAKEVTRVGSGFIISEAGYILTSASLIDKLNNLSEIEAILYNGDAFSVQTQGITQAANLDIALMQFSEEFSYQDENGQKMTGMPDVVEFSNSDDLEYGENCAYIATYSDSEDYFVSLAEGIVSKPKNTDSDFSDYINGKRGNEAYITADYLVQTSITSNEGNEGSALFDSEGKVAGVLTTKAEDIETYKRNNGYGMSFCVPSTAVYDFIEACAQDPDYADLSVEIPESTKTEKNYISNPDEIIVQSENALSEKFESTSGTKIASDSAVVELAYQGETEKDGSLAKYITDNYQNFTVNVLTAVASGQHASSGSGFVISTDGYVITNLHVINSSLDESGENNPNNVVTLYPYVYCTFENGTYDGKIVSFAMEVVSYDKQRDMALLKFKNEFKHYDQSGNLVDGFEKICKLADYSDLRAGEPVVALGNALGYGSSVTNGVVTLIESEVDYQFYAHMFIETDTPINSGNSGGALFNAQGYVVGINSMGAPSYENVSWAIPTDCITSFLDQTKQLRSSATIVIVNQTLAQSVTYQK